MKYKKLQLSDFGMTEITTNEYLCINGGGILTWLALGALAVAVAGLFIGGVVGGVLAIFGAGTLASLYADVVLDS